jgi:hypothetical protein
VDPQSTGLDSPRKQGAAIVGQPHPVPTTAWQRELRIKIGWALAVKLAGLLLLWFLFFRGTHS